MSKRRIDKWLSRLQEYLQEIIALGIEIEEYLIIKWISRHHMFSIDVLAST
jgi:hypothetical protein